MNPLVSIIVPVYNAEKQLDRCLKSLVNQSLEEIEIILVDDGSSDNSLSICQEYANADSRVLVIHQDNKGPAAARNAGLNASRGKFIGFVDSDDYVSTEMYKEMYDCAVNNQAEIVFCNILKNDVELQPYLEDGLYKDDSLSQIIFPRLISVVDNDNSTRVLRGAVWCKLFSKQLIDSNKIRFEEDLIYNEDGLFSISCTVNCSAYYYLGSKYLYHNVVTAGSLTKRYINDLWNRQKVIFDKLEKCVSDCNYDFSDQINKKIFEVAVYSIENEAKRSNKKPLICKLNIIKEIIDDPILDEPLRLLKGINLKRIESWYIRFMRKKQPLMLLLCAKYRYRNNKLF